MILNQTPEQAERGTFGEIVMSNGTVYQLREHKVGGRVQLELNLDVVETIAVIPVSEHAVRVFAI